MLNPPENVGEVGEWLERQRSFGDQVVADVVAQAVAMTPLCAEAADHKVIFFLEKTLFRTILHQTINQ